MLPKIEFPDRITLLNLIKSSGKSKNLVQTKRIHNEILKKSLISKDAYIATALVTAYARCGVLEKAEEVFEQIPVKDVVSWNALITGYAQHGLASKASKCLKQMKITGIRPDSVTYICILKACSIVGSLEIGEEIDAEVRKQELLQKDVVLGNTLVAMYAKCGALMKAREVFDQLRIQNVVSWNALIAGYAHCGLGHEALKCFQQMRDDGVCPDSVTYICVLKCCGIIGSLDLGKDIDAEVRKQGLLQTDIAIGNTLVDMYSKCGALDKAKEVFQQLPMRDVVSWNALIAGYIQHGQGDEALGCFPKMQDEGVRPNLVTYVCILKACGAVKSLEMGVGIHREVRKQGLLKKEVVLGNALVDMYSKCGELKKSREVFEQLPLRDVISWNALITGYAQHGLGDEALKCFRQMEDEGVHPDIVTYVCIVKACAIVGSLQIADKLDADIRKQGFEKKDIVLGNALVDMYFKCGAPQKAYNVFRQLPVRDVVSWNALIAGYTQHGLGNEALEFFIQMQEEGINPDAVTYICILKTCGIVKSLELGKEIDSEIRRHGLLQKDIVLGTALVDMYSKCGAMQKAYEVFEKLPERNVVTWGALIAGYVQHGLYHEALKFFRQMQAAEVCPDALTYVGILKACGILGFLEIGEEIDVETRKEGLLHKYVVLGSALVDMYSKCGALEKARKAFDDLPEQNIVTWSALIDGYAQHQLCDEALKCFRQMQDAGICPNAATYVSILKVCGIMGSLDIGGDVDAEVRRQGLLNKNVVLGTALVEMYFKCGALEKALELFEELQERNVVTWNAVIDGYARHGRGDEALKFFRRMQDERICPNVFTYVCVVKACGILGCRNSAEDIDAEVRKEGLLLQNNVVLGGALVDMHAKCGALEKAQEVFEQIPVRNVVAWSALITGYAQLGEAHVVLELYRGMKLEGITPDSVTFIVLLTACSHTGMVVEGEKLFDEMHAMYHITPTLEHYTCMIDLFGRAGHFEKAVSVINEMPSSKHIAVWSALLGACQKWDNLELGIWAFENAIQIDKNQPSIYVCMSNIYAAAGRNEEAHKIEALRAHSEAGKKPGCAWWMDETGKIHSFCVGDTEHSQSKRIYAKLKVIGGKMLKKGCTPSLLGEANKDFLFVHSQMLAIACAFINAPKGSPIHIETNMRISGDCHSATSILSKLEKREISIRDANLLHVFKDGKCSCGDDW